MNLGAMLMNYITSSVVAAMYLHREREESMRNSTIYIRSMQLLALFPGLPNTQEKLL